MDISQELKETALEVSKASKNGKVWANDLGELFTEEQYAISSVDYDKKRYAEVVFDTPEAESLTAEEIEANKLATEAEELKRNEEITSLKAEIERLTQENETLKAAAAKATDIDAEAVSAELTKELKVDNSEAPVIAINTKKTGK